MSSSPRPDKSIFAYPFAVISAIALALYILRGFGLLGFIPGGILMLLFLLSLGLGIAYGIDQTFRY
ncbi:MAG: hypothetical protein WBG70_21090 [Spirulinaceae cyanobacterium]